MANKTLFTLSLVATTALGTAAFADSHKRHHSGGEPGHMMHMKQMMEHMHGRMHENERSGMREGHDMKGKHRMMGGMKKMLDANGDGEVTPEEAEAQLQAKLKEYDADGNGSLSISEYEALHSAMIREKMVDRFQHLDADGDGQIMPDEMKAPAQHMKRMRHMKMKMRSATSGSQSGMSGMDGESGTEEN